MKEEMFVTVELAGQLGNQLFQIATAYAYSLDQGIPLLIPNFFQDNRWNIAANATRLFVNRIQDMPLPGIPDVWREPSLNYTPIPKRQR
ncbi:MAG: hypothetical protein K940chlam6_00619, partial [Chlamydiae bacterium]|nr:hypothetical protein [Chlamydiota bacterium]